MGIYSTSDWLLIWYVTYAAIFLYCTYFLFTNLCVNMLKYIIKTKFSLTGAMWFGAMFTILVEVRPAKI